MYNAVLMKSFLGLLCYVVFVTTKYGVGLLPPQRFKLGRIGTGISFGKVGHSKELGNVAFPGSPTFCGSVCTSFSAIP